MLGYVGLDNQGMSGIEYAFEEALKGRKETVLVTTDARRRPVGHTEKPSTEGLSVVLALDESIQHMAERELDRAMAETPVRGRSGGGGGAAHGRGPGHGQPPDLQPQPLRGLPGPSRWKNRAVADAYEPGSIFKIVTAAAGLQERVVEPARGPRLRHGAPWRSRA